MSPHLPENSDLRRALAAIHRSQSRWLADLTIVCQGDPRFLDAFRRWREWLTLLKLQLIRAEDRLLHYLLVPEERRPWRDFPLRKPSQADSFRRWDSCITPYFKALHIDTRFRRLGDVRDLDGEASIALASTDLVAVASIAEHTQAALRHVAAEGEAEGLEDLAFFHVLAPWKVQGLRPLTDVLQWLDAFLAEMDEL
ncbi:MAG: hypothetical protein EA402_09290 [Planctomycetota bacterium]|nr:MAG: hypothetical protein EA402_09290 [Planctomycetota bacterium]